MASRILSLEKSLAKSNDGDSSVFGTNISKNSSTSSSAQPVRLRDDDVLVEKGSSSQYFNEVILSRVIEEVRLHTILKYSRTYVSDCLHRSEILSPFFQLRTREHHTSPLPRHSTLQGYFRPHPSCRNLIPSTRPSLWL